MEYVYSGRVNPVKYVNNSDPRGLSHWRLFEISWTRDPDDDIFLIARRFKYDKNAPPNLDDSKRWIPKNEYISKNRYVITKTIPKENLPSEISEDDDFTISEKELRKMRLKKKRTGRWYIDLDENFILWEWMDKPKEKSQLAYLLDNLRSCKDTKLFRTLAFSNKEIKQVAEVEISKRTVPVIYQPSMDRKNDYARLEEILRARLAEIKMKIAAAKKNDSLDEISKLETDLKIVKDSLHWTKSRFVNYVREIHCHRVDSNKIQVSLVFADEVLRKFGFLDKIYKEIREFLYNRTIDIESFEIELENALPVRYNFKKIHSGDHSIHYDNIHETKSSEITFFYNMNRPVVFVNTSNHAMAEKDNNEKLWKREFFVCVDASPLFPCNEGTFVRYGTKSRDELDEQFQEAKLDDVEFIDKLLG